MTITTKEMTDKMTFEMLAKENARLRAIVNALRNPTRNMANIIFDHVSQPDASIEDVQRAIQAVLREAEVWYAND